MKPFIRTYLCNDENQRFFGEGPRQLLHAIEETGSLRSAALSMNMAYTKALRIIRDAETTLGFPLTVRTTGGKGGGGSQITAEAREFLAKYEAYRDACTESGQQLYEDFFAGGNLVFSLAEHKRPLALVCKIQTRSVSPASSWLPVLENVSARTSSWLRSTVLRSSTRYWM
ncbi:winged helix-turn-helix domain-containing protein [Clostridium fessum]|uniref:winged helix-turn-helix domain-containing protein n=1 Tax=Clostridium fessum TaxID=2126740 RepID=UPI003AEFAD0E